MSIACDRASVLAAASTAITAAPGREQIGNFFVRGHPLLTHPSGTPAHTSHHCRAALAIPRRYFICRR